MRKIAHGWGEYYTFTSNDITLPQCCSLLKKWPIQGFGREYIQLSYGQNENTSVLAADGRPAVLLLYWNFISLVKSGSDIILYLRVHNTVVCLAPNRHSARNKARRSLRHPANTNVSDTNKPTHAVL